MILNVFYTYEGYCNINIHFKHVGSSYLANYVILIKIEIKHKSKTYLLKVLPPWSCSIFRLGQKTLNSLSNKRWVNVTETRASSLTFSSKAASVFVSVSYCGNWNLDKCQALIASVAANKICPLIKTNNLIKDGCPIQISQILVPF